MPEAFRTPEDRFAEIGDYPYEPRFIEYEGLRVAYVEDGPANDSGADGSAPVALLLHGMPTWGYLWRKVMPPLVAAGCRVVVPDLLGFGRSDKPRAVADYTFDRHCGAIAALIDELSLTDINFVMHDWGGPIGTRVAADRPELIATATLMDTGFNIGDFKMSEAWQTFHDFVVKTEDLPIGFIVKGAVAGEMSDDAFAAYEAPFPEPAAKAGARAFPPMIPREPSHPDAVTGRRAMEVFADGAWPKLVLWADQDPVLPRSLGDVLATRIGAGQARTIENAGHFLQEDQGELIGETIAAWLSQASILP